MFGIEPVGSMPCRYPLVVLMMRIIDDVQELFIPRYTTDILRRTGLLSIQKNRMVFSFACWNTLLKFNLMLPAVTKIIDVGK